MSDSLNVNDLSEVISVELKRYNNKITDKMFSGIDTVCEQVVEYLETSPDTPVRTGAYKKSFKIKKVKEGIDYKRNVVYSSKHWLTHLLEYGHLTRDGKTRSMSFPHWKKAQAYADSLVDKMLEGLLDENS